MNLTTYVKKYVSASKYYKETFPEWDGKKSSNIACPFHENDNTPSFSVNIGRQEGCYCHGCNQQVASIIHCEKLLLGKDATDEDAAQSIYDKFINKIIDVDGECNQDILKGAEYLAGNLSPIEELGFTSETVKQFKLNWDSKKQRLLIPIFNQWGHLINVRFYAPPSYRGGDVKFKIYNLEGFGSPSSLFPLNIIERVPVQNRKIYWHKAERDTILSWQMGIPAFCSTNGEGTIEEHYLRDFKRWGYMIIIVGDNDKPGIIARQKRLEFLEKNNITCGWVEIPEEKDFADWVSKGGKTTADFHALEIKRNVEELIDIEEPDEIEIFPGLQDLTLTPLEGEYRVEDVTRNADVLDQAIEVTAIIASETKVSFGVPHIIQVGNKIYKIPIGREMVQCAGISDEAMIVLFQKLLGSKKKEIKILSRINVADVEIIPVLIPGKEMTYVHQRCYFFGDSFKVNIPYKMKIIPTTRMRDQITVGLIYHIEPVSEIARAYEINDDDIEKLLNRFNVVGSGPEIYLKMIDLVNEVADKYTMIYNRNDLHLLQILTWISPLLFNFHKEGQQRGWLNSLVLGDTQTGKSEIAKKLQQLFAAGVFISSENCSFVGLVGGTVKGSSGNFMLRWGKIPLYNEQLVVLEELSGLTCEEISKMSDVRSSGIARIDKAGLVGETNARTRLLCISNVRRKESNLGDYNSGVKAVQELIGQSEDISRFDLILTTTDREVSNEIINRDRSQESCLPYSEDEIALWRKLIIFIWKLKPEQINFTDEAYIACLNTTIELAKIYHASVPIFKAGSGRLKLARIACAIAALTFSWDKNLGKLVVTKNHVHAATILLKQFWNKPSLGYGKYSKQKFYLESIKDESNLTKVIDISFKGINKTKKAFFEYVVINGSFEVDEISQALNIPKMVVERLVSALFTSHVIRRSALSHRIVWETTFAGRNWLESKCHE